METPDPRLPALESFLAKHPHINYVTRASPDYAQMRATYILNNPAVPLAIARPKSAEDVALLLSYSVSHGIEVVVRSGGNNLFGKSMVQDALTIDMRDIAFVDIDETNSSARIGGGILAGALATELSKHELATAFGSVAFLGYVGWSTYGGYGPLSSKYGLGVDQILGAKVVTSEGAISEADPEMLKGIRGAGGNFGIIVELNIKVYPLKRVLGGVIEFESENINTSIQRFNVGYQGLVSDGLPLELGLQQTVVNTPQGRTFVVIFMWASDDHELGRSYLDKVLVLGTVVQFSIKSTTTAELLVAWGDFLAGGAYGSTSSINVHRLTSEVTAIIGRHIENMPYNSLTGFSIHHLRGPSATPNPDSVFGAREPHYMLEFIQTVDTESEVKASRDWAAAFRAEIQELSVTNIIRSNYISLTPPGKALLSDIYGSNYRKLLELQKKYDPNGVFDKAVPRLFS